MEPARLDAEEKLTMTLPHGALEALLGDGGTAAFDAVVEADRAATQAATQKREPAPQQPTPTGEIAKEEPKPILAKNAYNNRSQQPPKPVAKTETIKQEGAAVVPDGAWDLEAMSDDDVIRLAAVDPGAIPSNLEWD